MRKYILENKADASMVYPDGGWVPSWETELGESLHRFGISYICPHGLGHSSINVRDELCGACKEADAAITELFRKG